MKTSKILIAISLVFTSLFMSCGDAENVTFDPTTGQTLARFSGNSATIPVNNTGVSSTDITVEVTTSSTSDRTIAVEIDESSTADISQYTITDFTIPAGEYTATATVVGLYDGLPESGAVNLVLNLSSIAGSSDAVIENGVYTVTLERFCPLVIEDFYGIYSAMQSTTDFASVTPGPEVTITAGSEPNTLLLTNLYGAGRSSAILLDYSDILNPAVIHVSTAQEAVYQTFPSTGPLYTFSFDSQAADNTFSTCNKTIRLNYYRANAAGGAYNPPYFVELTKI